MTKEPLRDAILAATAASDPMRLLAPELAAAQTAGSTDIKLEIAIHRQEPQTHPNLLLSEEQDVRDQVPPGR